MRSSEPTPAEVAFWSEHDSMPVVPVTIGGPEEGDDVIPCPALVSAVDGQRVTRVRWQLDEIELAALAQGGSLWLTTWGGLPVHALDVLRVER